MIKHIKNCDIYTAETPGRFRSDLYHLFILNSLEQQCIPGETGKNKYVYFFSFGTQIPNSNEKILTY